MTSRAYKNESDSAIIRRVIDGHTEAFEIIMERYQHHVLGIVKRNIPFELAAKIVQDVFVRAYKALKNFKLGEPLKPWLTTIALRTCYDYWRRQYRSREIVMSSLSIDHCKWLDRVLAEQATESWRRDSRIDEARQVLDWALSRLSAEDRMALTLTYLEGYSNREAARLLGWSTANIKIRMLRARRKLHQLLIGSHREATDPVQD